MKCRLATLLLTVALLVPAIPVSSVSAAGETLSGTERDFVFQESFPIYLNGHSYFLPGTTVQNWITYVPLRALVSLFQPDWTVSWTDGQGIVEAGTDLRLAFRPGEEVFSCNGTELSLPGPVLTWAERLLIPVRPLAAILGAEVEWSPERGVTISAEESDKVFWLSRIISAESQGETLEGQIAVGNVVLNRVANSEFPDSIYRVIFEPEQFEPVRNGTIWNVPTQSSMLAARLALAGVTVVDQCLYFLAPELTDNHWTMENREYVTTIGVHWFYR